MTSPQRKKKPRQEVVSDTEMNITPALFICIDIKHCDVYYVKVPKKHIANSNTDINEWMKAVVFFALGKQIIPTTSFLQSRGEEKNLTPDISCNPLQK